MEVMISTVLIAILLGGLMGYLRFSTDRVAEADKRLLPELQKSYAHQQLSRVLTEVVPIGDRGSFFSSPKGDSLYFYYNHGVDRDHRLCGDVMAQIWLDSAGRVALSIWPSPLHWGEVVDGGRTVYLLDGVKEIAFRFYQPPNGEEGGEWRAVWRDTDEGIPAMIELTLTITAQLQEKMVFIPTQSGKPLLYSSEVEEAL